VVDESTLQLIAIDCIRLTLSQFASTTTHRCIFVGTLIVVPDVSKLKNRADGPGMRRSGRRREDGGGEGVTGLKALGVRDLTYRIAFLACSVTSADGSLRDEDTKEDIQAQFSESERHELMLMAQQPNLVSRMRRSVAPTVFGHEDIKLGR
jgi:DNA replication licensing factor MCM6